MYENYRQLKIRKRLPGLPDASKYAISKILSLKTDT